MRLLVALVLLLSAWPVQAASAFVVQERGILQSFANGITRGPDGNLWAVEQSAGKVVRVAPDGSVLGRFAVGPDPTSITTGPGGRVWVAVTGADKLVWFDATSPAPTSHDVATASLSNCGPVAVEAGFNGRIYFSLPNDGSGAGGCTDPNRIGSTNADGTGGSTAVGGRGQAYDLHVSGGKLFVPDLGGDVVRRLALDAPLTVESSVTVSGGNPNGVTTDPAGRVWVTLFTSGAVAHFPATQSNGSAVRLDPVGGTLSLPFGITTGGDGRIYVTGRDSENLARIDPTTMGWTFFGVPGAKPWQIVPGPDDDLWFTDVGANRLLRFVSGKPRATTGQPQVPAATAAVLRATIDPRGNATTVTFDYGPSPAFGTTTAPIGVAEGVGAVEAQAGVSELTPATTYHVRVRATNAEGETLGETTTFTTPAAPPIAQNPPPVPDRLAALIRFRWRVLPAATRLTRVRTERLAGGETVRITCRGRGCPFRARTVRDVRAGSRRFDRLFVRRRLRPGVRVQVRITKAAAVGVVATLHVRRGRKPRIVRRCLPPGVATPTRC